jgi:hypothetical protein
MPTRRGLVLALLLVPLSQPHPGTAAVLVDELDRCCKRDFEGIVFVFGRAIDQIALGT